MSYEPPSPDQRLVANRARYATHRAAAIAASGGKCVRCGFDDPRALQFDHIDGGGVKELGFTIQLHGKVSQRKQNNVQYLDDIAGGRRPDIQLLCANCNWIKRIENNENRRKAVA